MPFKPGIGKISSLTNEIPVIIPVHMRDLPKCKNYHKVIPSIGKTVRILVGEPIDIHDILVKYREITAQHGYSRTNEYVYHKFLFQKFYSNFAVS